MVQPDESWGEYRRLVLAELKRLTEEIVGLRTSVQSLTLDVSGLKLKAAIAGGIAGMVGAAAIGSIVAALFKVM